MYLTRRYWQARKCEGEELDRAGMAEAMAGLSAAMASLLNARENTRTSASSIGLLINA